MWPANNPSDVHKPFVAHGTDSEERRSNRCLIVVNLIFFVAPNDVCFLRIRAYRHYSTQGSKFHPRRRRFVLPFSQRPPAAESAIVRRSYVPRPLGRPVDGCRTVRVYFRFQTLSPPSERVLTPTIYYYCYRKIYPEIYRCINSFTRTTLAVAASSHLKSPIVLRNNVNCTS